MSGRDERAKARGARWGRWDNGAPFDRTADESFPGSSRCRFSAGPHAPILTFDLHGRQVRKRLEVEGRWCVGTRSGLALWVAPAYATIAIVAPADIVVESEAEPRVIVVRLPTDSEDAPPSHCSIMRARAAPDALRDLSQAYWRGRPFPVPALRSEESLRAALSVAVPRWLRGLASSTSLRGMTPWRAMFADAQPRIPESQIHIDRS